MVVAFLSDISQLSFVTSLSDVYPSKHECLLPCFWWMVGSLTSTLLSRGSISPRTTSPAHCDQTSSMTQYLSVFICTSLSLGYLTFSSVAHGPILIFEPFIPTNTIDSHFYIFFNSLKNFVRILLGIKCKLSKFFFFF